MGVIDDTVGAVFIGVIVAATLYGFTCVQTWYYFAHYPSDPWYIKFIVILVLLLDTGHQVLITHLAYTYAITYFGVYDEIKNVVWSMIVEVFFNTFTTLFVQCFLAVRVYRLSNKSWLATGPVVVFIIAEFVATIVFGINGLQIQTYVELATLNALSMTVNVLGAAGDVLIAVLLCVMLHTSRTGFRKSNTMISKLIVFSINTGLLTSLCAIASLLCITVWPQTWIYIGFYFCIGRLYCNSLLATLNARKVLRGGFLKDDDNLLSLHTHTLQQGTNHTILGTSSKMPSNISIKVDTTKEYIRDEQSLSNDCVKNGNVV